MNSRYGKVWLYLQWSFHAKSDVLVSQLPDSNPALCSNIDASETGFAAQNLALFVYNNNNNNNNIMNNTRNGYRSCCNCQ